MGRVKIQAPPDVGRPMSAERVTAPTRRQGPGYLDSEMWELRFVGGVRVPLRVDHYKSDAGEWHYAWAQWPGIESELHLAGNTARYAAERLVACGITHADTDEQGSGFSRLVSPDELRQESAPAS